MNLIIDIGNTRTKLAIFGKGRMLKTGYLSAGWTMSDLQPFIGKRQIDHVAIASVAEPDAKLLEHLAQTFDLLNLSESTPVPIKNAYRTPRTLGRDRLAVAVAAAHLFPQKNALIIDAGTCITYDFIDSDGTYRGGSICPGIHMRLEAMHRLTARLPLVKAGQMRNTVGRDTKTSLQTGAQWGALLEMTGFIGHYRDLFGEIEVLLTGGDANYFANHLKTKIFVNPNLVLIGLNQILNYNVQLLE